jgi:hypothetical protein
MKSISMLTLAPLPTIQNHVTFVMMPSRSFTPTMAAAPWWIEHLHKSGTPASMQRWYVIDSAWRNVMISCYLAATSHAQSFRTTRSSSPALNSWLMPEALQELALPSSLKFHHQSPPPATFPHHPDLNPLTPDQKPQLAFPQSLLAKALWTSPLPLSYHTRMGSLHTPFLPQTTLGSRTRSPSVATAKSGGMTRPHARTPCVTFAPPITTPPLHVHILTSVARTTIAGSRSATPTMDLLAQHKST